MSKKSKKMGLGKRLWHSITEPIPDDNEDQNSEQIPLAYDLKGSSAPTAESAAKDTSSSVSASAATQSTEAATEIPADSAAPQTRAAMREARESAAAQSQATASQQGTTATVIESAVSEATKVDANAKSQVTKPVAPAKAHSAQATITPRQAAKSAPRASVSEAVIEPDLVAESAGKQQGRVVRAAAPKSAEDPDAATSTISLANSTARVATGRKSQAAAATNAVSGQGQPVISVNGAEHPDSDETTPELPLSREELYGDQQPNGGSEAPRQRRDEVDVEPMSRLARHGENESDETLTEATSENPHLKKKGSRPHQKPKQRKNGKLVATGVVLLIVAALGAFFMFNRAKTTEANARTNAETVVKDIYTSSAQRDLRADASKAKLAQLQTYIDEMKQSDSKTALQTQHDNAAKMLKIRQRYDGLYNTDKLVKASVTMADVTNAQNAITDSGLKTRKTYFTKKYDKKLTATAKIVKPVRKADAEFKKLYNSKDKLKSSVSTSDLDKVLKHLKAYRTKSQLAADDYKRLTTDRKALAKKEHSAATSAANAVSSSSSSYSEPESSSYSSDESSSSSDTTYSSTTDTTSGNDTGTTSTDSSSSTTYYDNNDYSSSSSSSTSYGTDNTTSSSTDTSDSTGVSTYSSSN